MNRRAFLTTLSGSLLGPPFAAQAQQTGKVYTIGWLTLSASPVSITFRQALQSLGWIEGKNVVILYKTAEFRSERLSQIVAEFVDLKVDVIVAVSAEAALAAKRGTETIPIVAVDPADAVAIGLVASLARPGGNVTGLSYLGTELASKQMELFKETIPTLSRVAILTNPANPTHLPRREAAAGTARRLGVKSETLTARTPGDLEKAFGEMARLRVGDVLVVTDPMFNSATAAGGLMSYGVDLADLFRRAPTYVDKILKGAKPADLPVEQPTKFDLVINLKTAKALGLTIPPSLLGRADEVIQ
jgi:ABC-type uncharacterized transport system substrate-binding protein